MDIKSLLNFQIEHLNVLLIYGFHIDFLMINYNKLYGFNIM